MKTPEVTYGVMADCQFADADDFDGKIKGSNDQFKNCYRLAPQKLREAIELFNQHELDFIIHLGDFTDRDINDADDLNAITSMSRTAVKHVLGNHEFWIPGTNPQDVIRKYGMPDKYYSFEVNDNKFVVLDTNELGPLEHPVDSVKRKIGYATVEAYKRAGRAQAYEWNGGLSDQQMDWLDEELTEADNNSQKAFLFAHHPLFPPHALNALNDIEIMQMIDSHDSVKAFINGHHHGGNYGERNGVAYWTVNGMLTGQTNAYAIARVYEDEMTVEGYGRVDSRTINFA